MKSSFVFAFAVLGLISLTSEVSGQNFGNVPSGTVIGNPSTNTAPVVPMTPSQTANVTGGSIEALSGTGTLNIGANTSIWTPSACADTILNLPVNPANNEPHTIVNAGNCLTNSLTINGNGHNIGIATAVVGVSPGSIQLRYSTVAGNWQSVGIAGPVSVNAPAQFIGNAPIVTADGYVTQALNQPGISASQIYKWAFGGGTPISWDNVRSVVQANNGSTTTNITGFASYIDNELASNAGVSQNTANYFGVNVVGVNNAWSWGANYVLTDSKTQSASSLTGVNFNGVEINPNIWSTSTVLNGVHLVGASGAQPALANGFVVNLLDIVQTPPRARWSTAFLSANGAAAGGLLLGAANVSGTNIASQTANFNVFDSAGLSKTYQFQGVAGPTISSFNFSHTIGGTMVWAFDSHIDITAGFQYQVNSDNLASSDSSHDVSFAAGSAIVGVLFGNNTAPISFLTPSLVYAAPTGTPVASLCLDTNNHIVKKTTAGSCI